MPNTVGIIDGTEIFIQQASNLATHKSSYSDYKSHTTVKYIVALLCLLAFLETPVIDLLWKAVLSLIYFSQVTADWSTGHGNPHYCQCTNSSGECYQAYERFSFVARPNRINKQILDDMVIVSCVLCNLQPPLIVS